MSAAALKWIALVLMLVDHIGEFFGGITPVWFRWLGRLSAPLFLFCLAKGLEKTRSRPRYLRRLWIGSVVMGCSSFEGEGFDDFLMSQMWDCQEDRERIFRECQYQVVAIDMLAAALPALERANLDADFIDALAELYPTCEAFYFQNSGKLFLAEDVRTHQIEGPDRFIKFGVNVRFFNIQGTDDMLVDTLGMGTLFLPDLQYHFHVMDPNWVVNHAYNVLSYILVNNNPIKDGETVDGVKNGKMSRRIQWTCQYENALIQPPREVLDINMGEYASGNR